MLLLHCWRLCWVLSSVNLLVSPPTVNVCAALLAYTCMYSVYANLYMCGCTDVHMPVQCCPLSLSDFCIDAGSPSDPPSSSLSSLFIPVPGILRVTCQVMGLQGSYHTQPDSTWAWGYKHGSSLCFLSCLPSSPPQFLMQTHSHCVALWRSSETMTFKDHMTPLKG